MLRRIVAVTLTALLVGVVAPPGAHAAQEPAYAVRALLDARAGAERNHDRTAFAATIDPQAPAAFREAQLRGFDNLSALPVESLDYQVRTDLFGDLSHAVNRAEYGNARVYLPETVRRLRFTLDAGRAGLDEMWWTYVERDGKWYVAGDDDVTDVGLESTKSMWDLGPVVAVTSAHVMLLAHPEDKERAAALLALTESALGTVAQRWTLPWAGHLVGFLPHSPDELVTLIQATVDVTKFIAFVSYSFDPDTLTTSAPRLYVQDTNLSKYTPDGQTETLVHEFTHAAASGYTGVITPAWLQEGAAEWIARGPSGSYPRRSGSGEHAPRDDDFGAGSQAQILRAYNDALSLVAELARLVGPDGPERFFKQLSLDNVRPGNDKYLIDDALRQIGAPDLAGLEASWRNR